MVIGKAVLLRKGTGKKALPHTKHGEKLCFQMPITNAKNVVLPKGSKLTISGILPIIQNSEKLFQMALVYAGNVIKNFIPFTD